MAKKQSFKSMPPTPKSRRITNKEFAAAAPKGSLRNAAKASAKSAGGH